MAQEWSNEELLGDQGTRIANQKLVRSHVKQEDLKLEAIRIIDSKFQ